MSKTQIIKKRNSFVFHQKKIKNMKKVKLLIVACLIASVSFTSCEKEEKIQGCTDIAANNYNPVAEIENATCEFDANVVFWINSNTATLLSNNGVTSLVFIVNNAIVGSMSTAYFYTSAPLCGASQCLTLTNKTTIKKSEIIPVTVTNQNGVILYTYNVDFIGGTCQNFQIS